jgi:hypothetical protein
VGTMEGGRSKHTKTGTCMSEKKVYTQPKEKIRVEVRRREREIRGK